MPEEQPTLNSKSAICVRLLSEYNSTVLCEKDADRIASPASITKLLAAITALKIVQEKKIRTPIRMTVAADDRVDSSGQDLREGDVVSLRHGLANLLMASSNITANVIARSIGSILANDEGECSDDPTSRFVAEMNAVAANLKMTRSRFLNPHGLAAKGQRSTARDLSRLVLACLHYPVIGEFWGLRKYAFAVGGPNARTIVTRSIFHESSLAAITDFSIPQFKGGKSGTLWPSIFNMAAVSETTSGNLMVSVTLGCSSIAGRHADYLALLKVGNQVAAFPDDSGQVIKPTQ